MNSMIKTQKHFLLIAALAGTIACSSKPTVKKIPVTASPTDEMAILENNIQDAGNRNVDILSPKNFKAAKNYLSDAKEKFNKGKSAEATLRDVEYGSAYLTRANASADVARENTQSILSARSAAIKANAPLYFSKKFKDADEEFADLTKDIEKNRMSNVDKLRPKLQAKYLELELNSIKEANLKDSRAIIEMAKKEDAKKYAPRTLAIAENNYAETEEYITANRHNSAGIARHARDTINSATHALNINRLAKSTDKVSPEEVALMMDREKQRVATRDSELQMTEDELHTTQSALQRERKAKEVELQKTEEELAAEKKKLDALKGQEEKYEMARQTFNSDEAEVYKQGDDLLIRLKGMEFPSAGSNIQSKNFPLLSKVKKVINEFGSDAVVVVEGHTDAVGGKKVNQELSEKRAESVKEYLKSTLAWPEEKIEAKGLGDEKPIAANKTAKGRAQNRRVDIIIKPESSRL